MWPGMQWCSLNQRPPAGTRSGAGGGFPRASRGSVALLNLVLTQWDHSGLLASRTMGNISVVRSYWVCRHLVHQLWDPNTNSHVSFSLRFWEGAKLEEEAEAEKGEITGPGVHSQWTPEGGWSPGLFFHFFKLLGWLLDSVFASGEIRI